MIRSIAKPALALLVLLALAALAQRVGFSHLERSQIDPLGYPSRTPDLDLLSTGAGFGLLLLGGWLAGRIAQSLTLPKITGFLLFGVMCGPTALGLIRSEELSYLKLVDSLAVALIALTAGGEIRLSFLRGSARRIAIILGIQVFAAFIGMTLVGFGVIRVLKWDDSLTATGLLLASMLLGTVAAASSPAVVIAVISELRARGPLSQTILAVTICKDLVVIVLFAVIATAATGVFAVAAVDDPELIAISAQAAHAPSGSLTFQIAWHLLGSILAGALAGLAMAFYVHRVRANLAMVLILSCFAIALIAEALHLDPLIAALVGGLLMRNVWPHETEELFETIEDLSLPVYCMFFAVAGAKVNLGVLADVWIWALMLALARAIFIAAGTTLGARLTGVEPAQRRLLWMGFISRAGVSIALAGLIADTLGDHPLGIRLYNLVLATIALDELLGPLLLKVALSLAREAEPARKAAA